MKATEIVEFLRQAHQPPRWAFFEELRCSTGFGSYARKDDTEQRIDAWAMDTWAQKRAVAFEVKVSRSDWLRELKKPEKREASMRRSEQFYFAAPQGLIKPEEVPGGCGLVEVDAARLRAPLRWTVRAPVREYAQFDRGFIAMLVRRQYRYDRESLREEERARIDEELAMYNCLHATGDGRKCQDLHLKYAAMWCLPCRARHRREQRKADIAKKIVLESQP